MNQVLVTTVGGGQRGYKPEFVTLHPEDNTAPIGDGFGHLRQDLIDAAGRLTASCVPGDQEVATEFTLVPGQPTKAKDHFLCWVKCIDQKKKDKSGASYLNDGLNGETIRRHKTLVEAVKGERKREHKIYDSGMMPLIHPGIEAFEDCPNALLGQHQLKFTETKL